MREGGRERVREREREGEGGRKAMLQEEERMENMCGKESRKEKVVHKRGTVYSKERRRRRRTTMNREGKR